MIVDVVIRSRRPQIAAQVYLLVEVLRELLDALTVEDHCALTRAMRMVGTVRA